MKAAVIPLLLTGVLVLGGCGGSAAAEAPIEEKIIPVEATQISSGTIERNLIYAGQVKPLEQVMVLPKIAGKVEAVYFDVGDRVNKDDVLFSIDDTDMNNSINAAQAQYNATLSGVASAQASLENVSGAQTESSLLQYETNIKNAETTVENAGIGLENAKMTLDNTTITYENAKVLFGAGTMSKTDFDRIELGYNQALAGYEKAVNDKEQAETLLKQARESYDLYINKAMGSSVKQAQSGVNQAAASAETARVSLSNAQSSLLDLNVKSPINGIISAKNVTVGGMAGQSQPAFTVINMDTVEVSTSVSEELINVISPGMSVPVYVSSVRTEPFSGVISTISPAAEDIKNTYPVKITITNSDGALKPGMFAEVRFTKEKSENTVVLPRNAVLDEETYKYVFLAENGMAKKCNVETGIDNGKEIEIVGGLPDGALVITRGQTLIADGEKIKIVN